MEFDINDLDEELKKDVVRNKPSSIARFDNPSLEVCLEAVKKNGMVLGCIKNEYIKNKEVIKAAINSSGAAIYFVENQTEKLCLLAIKNNAYSIEAIKNPSEKLIYYAISKHPQILGSILHLNLSDKILLYAIKKNPQNIQKIIKYTYRKNPTTEMITTAISGDFNIHYYIGRRFITSEISSFFLKKANQLLNDEGYVKDKHEDAIVSFICSSLKRHKVEYFKEETIKNLNKRLLERLVNEFEIVSENNPLAKYLIVEKNSLI